MRTACHAAVLALLAVASAPAGEEPQIQVQVGSQQVYEGHAFRYLVAEIRLDKPVEPELRGFDDFDVRSKQLSAVSGNMRMTVSGSVGAVRGVDYWLYEYHLVPLRTGALRIPAPVVTVDGREYRGQEKTIEVVAPPEQDLALLEIAADRTSVYPTQRFTVTLSVFVKQLPEGYEKYDPTSVSAKRTLSIPWLLDANLPEGLQPASSQDRWSLDYRAISGVGFRIAGLSQVDDIFAGSPFPSFARSMFDEFTETFRPSRPERVRRADDTSGETIYWRYDFSRTFVAREPGRYRFGPASLEGAFATARDRFRERWQGRDVYPFARPIVVHVKEVPDEGRTEFFTGGIGRFDVRAELAPRKAKVNEPMTLTLTVTGEGTLESLRPPDLAAVDPIRESFKIYEPTAKPPERGSRSFTYSIWPLRPGIEELASVRMDYFDVEKERYVSVHTDPIPIEVGEADWLSADDVVAAGGAPAGSDEVELQREGLFVNITDPAALRNQAVHPIRWLGGLVAVLGIYVAVAVGIRQYQRLHGDKALQRRRAAAGRAKAGLRDGLSHLEAGRIGEGADRIRATVVGLVADVADLSEAGLTLRDVQAHLAGLGVEPPLVERLGRLLETCDAARYGAIAADTDDFAGQADYAVGELIEALRAKGRFR